MSNLFKSKFLLGVAIVAVMFVGFAMVGGTNTAAAASCSITSTLRLGSTGAEVQCLQTSLGGLTADGKFGPKTAAAVMAWQKSEGLTADGVFGAKSNTVWMGNAGNSANFPAGCASASGYSPSTGLPCSGGVSSNLPAGCTSTSGFSSTTGMACSVTTNLPAGCSSTSGFSPTTGMACNGTGSTTVANPNAAGNVSTDSVLGGFVGTIVGQGDVNHQVAGFQLTGAGGGSNLNLNSLTIQFNEDPSATGLTGSSRFNDYFNTVSIWENGKMIGSAPASAFSSNTSSSVSHYVYSASIPLTGGVVLAGQINNFYVAVSANTSLDSGNFSQNLWKLQVSNIRFTDGTGITLVYSPGSAIGTGSAVFANAPSFAFGSAATANNIVVNIGRSGSDQNSHTVTVTQNSGSTLKVPLLLMSVASQGGQAVAINQIPVVFTPDTGSQVYKMTGEVYLMQGTTVLDSEAVPSSGNCATNSTACTISFKINPSNPLIVSNSPVTLTVAADINSITGGAYTAGDSLTVSTPSATTAYDMTSGTPNGSELVTSTNATTVIPGTANGQAVAFFATGLNVNVATNTCTAQQSGFTSGPSVMTCTVNFSVTANGAPMYIPQASSSVATNASTVNFIAQLSGTGTIVSGTPGTRTVSVTYVQNGSVATNNTTEWIVPAGATANFTGTVIVNDSTSVSSGLYRAFLNDVRYGTGTGVWGSDYTFNLGATNPAVPGYIQLN